MSPSFGTGDRHAVLRETSFARYGLLSWSDALAAIPGGRVDRFGPPGFYETYRVDGFGAPVVLYEGVPVPGAGNGLTNGNALPFAGVSELAVGGAGVDVRAARALPDGVLGLRAEPWVSGVPRSLVWVDQGAGGYQRYLARFARDIAPSTYLRAHFQFRQNSSFVPSDEQNYRGREFDLRVGGSVAGTDYEAGFWSYADEQYVFDDSLQGDGGFSHTGEEEKSIARLRIGTPGDIDAQLYLSRATLSAVPLAGDTTMSGEERRDGAVFTVPLLRRSGGADLTFGGVAERREATAGLRTRDRWETGGYLEAVRGGRAGIATVRAGGVVPWEDGASVIGNGELAFEKSLASRKLRISFARARREAPAEHFARGADHFGVANQAGIAISGPGAGGAFRLRYAYRIVDDALVPVAADPFFTDYLKYDERAHVAEAALAWDGGPLATELSYLLARSRAEGTGIPLPYHSDHVIRGRVALSRIVPYIQALGRVDLLGEWRSDRYAPGSDVPMDDYYYLRGRATLELRGADVYGQVERVTGHRLEYRDGIGGSAGVLSGTFQIYFGVRWPLED